MTARKILTALPVYNEADKLRPVLEEVRKHSRHTLVVNDGSTDGSRELLEREPGICLIHHPTNRGYGGGLKSAFDYAIAHDYDVLVTIDCDGQHQPCLIPAMATAVFPEGEEAVDVVSGSRYLKVFDGDSVPPESRRRINMTVNDWLKNRLGLTVTDSFCGFKAYRVEALKQLDVTEFGYAQPLQFWVQVVALGLRVEEFPVPLIYLDEKRSFGGSLDDADERLTHYREVFDREYARWFATDGSLRGPEPVQLRSRL